MRTRMRAVALTALAFVLPIRAAGAVAGLPVDSYVFIVGSTYYVGDSNISSDPQNPMPLPALTVTAGFKLMVTNLDTVAHTLVSDLVDADGRYLFTAPPPSIPFRNTVEVVGVSNLSPAAYGFHCDLHPGMAGTLVVESPIGG